MTLTLPTDIVPSVYSPCTKSAIATLAAASRDFACSPFAQQITNPQATRNIDNGHFSFAKALDTALTPPVARAMVLDHGMHDLIQMTLRDMRPTFQGDGFPIVYWYPNAIGVHWATLDVSNCPREAARSSSRLILLAAKSPSDALARRFEFDAVVSSWSAILAHEQRRIRDDFGRFQLKPPHLDCLLASAPRGPRAIQNTAECKTPGAQNPTSITIPVDHNDHTTKN